MPFIPLTLYATILLGLASPLSAARKASRAPSSAKNASLMRILTVENQRTLGDSYLATAIHHPTPSIRQAAILAVARIGEAGLLPELSGMLNHRRGSNKRDVAFALGIIPDETAVTMAVQHLAMQKEPEILRDLYLAIGRGGGEKHLPVFDQGLRNVANPLVLEGVCAGLGALWSKDSEHWIVPQGMPLLLIQRAKQTESLAVTCSFALSRFKGLPSHIPPMEIVKLGEETKSKEASAFLLRVLAKISNASASQLLISKAAPFNTASVRIEAVKALGTQTPSKLALSALKTALRANETGVTIESLESLQGFGPAALEISPTILEVFRTSPSTWVRSRALRAGMAIHPEAWKPVVLAELQKAKTDLRPAAAAAITLQPGLVETTSIIALLQDPSPRVALETLESLAAWPEGSLTVEVRVALKAMVDKNDPAQVATIAAMAERYRWKDFSESLAKADIALGPQWVETKTAIAAAQAAFAEISDVPRTVTAQSQPPPLPFTIGEVTSAPGTVVVLKTSRGQIHLRLTKDAPLNALHFARLVKKKFYDGLVFHRVIPGFVAQGGDPRGDGFGGPGYLVRDELSARSHTRGTVGLATSGKDTGGSQFFINVAPNLHLDGRYTLFAEVTKGMDVVDRLEVGDTILTARIQ